MSEDVLNLTGRLCRAVVNLRYEDLSPATIEAAKNVMVDATGVMMAAPAMAEETGPFLNLAAQCGPGPCSILGTSHTAPAPMAALANGALAHALDFEDTHDRTAGHPNASLLPALIALAHSEGPIDGRTFLTALVAGCEVSCRLAQSLGQPMEQGGWYPPPILAGFGAAVGAAKLLGLDVQGIRDAISLTLCQVTMPGQIKFEPGSTIRSVREAFPAQAAVQSALLARSGVRGFQHSLEGEAGFFALYAGGSFDASVLVRDFTAPFLIEELTLKPWPACRGTHAAIELALAYRAQTPGTLPHITRIVVEHDDVQAMLVEPLSTKRRPQTVIGAKFSIPFCTALALATGSVELDSFQKALRDDEVLALAAIVEGRRIDRREWGRGVGGALEMWSGNSLIWRGELDEPLGAPGRRIPVEGVDKKFIRCMRLRDRTDGDHHISMLHSLRSVDGIQSVGPLFSHPGTSERS